MYTIIITDLYAEDSGARTTSHQIQKETITIGRSRTNDIVIRQTNISTTHLSVTQNSGGLFVRDLNSTNGTKVNQRPLQGEMRVFSDDQIEIGGALLRLTGHPDLERNRRDSMASDDPGYEMPEEVGRGAPGPNLDDLAVPETGGGLPAGGTGFNEAQDFSLSSIAPMSSSDAPKPSVSLDSLFPYQDGGDLGGDRANGDSSDFNPFPVDADAMEMSQVLEGPGKDKLLEKIRKLESKAVKNAAPSRPKPRPRGIPLSNGSVLLPPRERPQIDQRHETPQQDVWPEPAGSQTAPSPQPTPANNPFGEPAPGPGIFEILVETRNVNAKETKSTRHRYKKARMTIGRNPDCDLCLSSSYISGRHVALEVENGLLLVKDLGSTNGTFLNGQELKEPAFLSPEDRVKLGEFILKAQLRESRAPSVTPSPDAAPFPTSLGASNFDAAPPPSSAYAPPGHSRTAADPDRMPGTARSAGTAGEPRPQGIRKDRLAQNFTAVAIQLHLARRAVGKALDELQNSTFESYEIRETCQEMAKAVKILYRSKDLENDFGTIQNVADAVLENLSATIGLVYHTVGYDDPSLKDLHRAYALLLPLSTAGVSDFERFGAMPGISIVSEMGYLGVKHKSVRPHKEDLLRDRIDIEGTLIAGSKFTNSVDYLPCARALARSVADIMYFGDDDRLKLENVVDEACTNVIEHAFDTQGKDSFYVSFVVLQDNRLAIAVDDLGLPIDIQNANREGMDGLGFKLMRAFCEEIRFINRGRRGKRLLMIMALPVRYSETLFHAVIANDKGALISDSGAVDIRLATPELAEQITTCVFRAHRYNYYDETLYRARELFAEIESGKRIAAVAVNANQIVIGYMSVSLESPKSRVGELGAAVVVPQTNTAQVASRLTTFLIDECRSRGVLGLNWVLTAMHPYEQIANTNLGLINTGMMFSHLPATEMGSAANGGGFERRQSVVSAYLGLNDAPERKVCLPTQYAAVLKTIYDKLGLNRQLIMGDTVKDITLPAISNVKVAANRSLGFAFMRIVDIGDDIVQVIRTQLLALQKEAVRAIYVDIPLATPAAQFVCTHLEQARACFSALIPETDIGDILRLQLVGFDVDMTALHVEGAFGKSILKGIATQRARITGLI